MKHVNQDSFCEGGSCLISACSQRKFRGDIEFKKFDVTIQKIKNFNLVSNLNTSNDSHQISCET